MDMQYRTVALEDGGDAGFSGYAATFWAVDSYGTALKPGAFKKTLRERGERIPLLWQHDPARPIGKNANLKEDKTGLRFDADVVTETRDGSEAMALLRAGVPLGMSFGFETIRAKDYDPDEHGEKVTWDHAPSFYVKNPEQVRIIEEVRLWESSVVTFPANEAAVITDVRRAAELDALQTLLEAIDEGRDLSDAQIATLDRLTTAWAERQRPEPEPSTPPTDPARRNTDIRIAIAQVTAQYGHLLGVQA